MSGRDLSVHGGDAGAVARAFGMKCVPSVRLDFSVNINPMGPPPCVRDILFRGIDVVAHYPPVAAEPAVAALARAHGVSSDSVAVGNGSTEIFGWIVQTLKPSRPAWVIPCYAGYAEVCESAGITGTPIRVAHSRRGFSVPLEKLSRQAADMIFLASPNNPTGAVLDPRAVLQLADSNPARWIILDESFVDFLPHAGRWSLVRKGLPGNLIVVKSLTKFFAIPGLRLGMACAHPRTLRRITQARPSWSVNALAQAAAERLYDDKEYLETSRRNVAALRGEFSRQLAGLRGFTVYPSEANFLLVRLPRPWTASRLQADLLRRGILIRSCRNFPGLGEEYCRLAVRPREETEVLMEALRAVVRKSKPGKPVSARKTPAVMVVGTMSNSGKSMLATGLCRYFARNGYRVAPFKAQNMSLNSFVTREGGEMGRAQVVQAQAAGLKPHTDMNPVLLKPMGDAGSQVIVNGRPIGNFPARAYYRMKARIRTAVRAAYDRLAGRYDLIILEGAGSPAEINLQAEDLVNMSMAEYAGASVILVADIDRGGVFASIFGTIRLLPERHRRLVSGIVINKFRGDKSLLDSGIRQIEQLTGVPVLGVLPYVRDLRLDDEDSVCLEDRRGGGTQDLDIVVVRLPRISNFTDFLPLEHTQGVHVRYESKASELGKPDLIIIPGTKNTCADLRFLQESGWVGALKSARRNKVPVFGICGGYQMMGSRVSDPAGVEGKKGTVAGLRFLPVSTILEREKELAQVSGVTEAGCPFAKAGIPFAGYEIHAGRTRLTGRTGQPLRILRRRSQTRNDPDGAVSADGLAFGCYVHGLFDNDPLRAQLVKWLCGRKGISHRGKVSARKKPADDLDRLADLLEKHVDMKRVAAWAKEQGARSCPARGSGRHQ